VAITYPLALSLRRGLRRWHHRGIDEGRRPDPAAVAGVPAEKTAQKHSLGVYNAGGARRARQVAPAQETLLTFPGPLRAAICFYCPFRARA